MSKNESATSNEPFDLAWAEIRRLELESYVADLDMNGFTVIPPQIASPGGLHKRLLDSVLDVAERKTGERPDLEGGTTHQGFKGRYAGYAGTNGDSPIGEYFQSLIF